MKKESHSLQFMIHFGKIVFLFFFFLNKFYFILRTHAGDVDTLNECLRESFVQLHSQPLLQQLLEEFKRNYPDIKFPPIPARGSLILEDVLTSPYFFH